jgi:hypothetical protein
MATIYGPYKRNNDGRWIIIVDGKTISYPKYLYEKHHNVKVEEPHTIDHIDGNPSNNSIENLRILTRSENSSLGSAGNQYALGHKWTETEKRLISGAFNQASKLSQIKVNEYRRLYESKQITKQQIIRETKMHRRSVENFLNYKTYK